MSMDEYLTRWYSKCFLKFFSVEEKTLFRKIENFENKATRLRQHLRFNEQCLQHDLYPIYTNILQFIPRNGRAFLSRRAFDMGYLIFFWVNNKIDRL